MLTAAEAAELLGLKPRTVYQRAAARLRACYRMGVGRGGVRFKPEDVEAYRESCRSDGTRETSAGATSSNRSRAAPR